MLWASRGRKTLKAQAEILSIDMRLTCDQQGAPPDVQEVHEDMDGWKVWAIRAAISAIVTAGIAYAVSFKVADYVVTANTSSINETLRAMQSSMDANTAGLRETMRSMQDSIDANTQAVRDLQKGMAEVRDTLSDIRADAREQATEISHMRDDLTSVKNAVQDYGIDIRAGFQVQNNNNLDWDSLREIYSIPEGAKIQWKMVPIIED